MATARERDPLTYKIIGAAMEVHRIMGPGHLEAVYHEAMEIEMALRGLTFSSKPLLELDFRGKRLRKRYAPDFIVEQQVVVEIKASAALVPADPAQTLNALKYAQLERALLFNFGEAALRYRRFILTQRHRTTRLVAPAVLASHPRAAGALCEICEICGHLRSAAKGTRTQP